MKRRDFIALLGGAATFIPLSASAQQSQPPLIGVLNAASAKSTASSYEAFRAGLRQLGYIEGRNIRIEYRYADGFLDRLPALAEEVVGLSFRKIWSEPSANSSMRKPTHFWYRRTRPSPAMWCASPNWQPRRACRRLTATAAPSRRGAC